jgi:hypothetical protein
MPLDLWAAKQPIFLRIGTLNTNKPHDWQDWCEMYKIDKYLDILDARKAIETGAADACLVALESAA